MFLTGGAMAMGIRAELFEPGLQLMDPIRYNQLVTMHGLIMIFGGVMPAFVGLANWLIPMQVGAPDMALPRMNNLSFGYYLLLYHTVINRLHGRGHAWFWLDFLRSFINKLSKYSLFCLCDSHMGISSIMGSINVIVTIMNMRAPGLSLMKMPLFVWSWLITAYLLIA